MSENPVIEGVHKDGSRVRIDISLTPIPGAATPLVLAVIHYTSVLINRYEWRANELRALTEIANLIKTGLDAHEVMERLSRQVRNLIPYDRFVVVTFDRVNSMVQDWFVAGQNASSHDPWSRYQLNTDQVRDYLGMKRSFITRSNSEHTLLSSMESNVERFKQGFRSLLCAPLIWNDEVLGVINFRSKSETAYDEDSLAIADQISAVAAAALGRKALLATTSQADHHRAVLSNISRIISQASDIQSVFDSVALQVDQVIPIERMVLASLNSDRTGYFDEAEWGQKTVNTATSVMNDLRGSATELAVLSDTPIILSAGQIASVTRHDHPATRNQEPMHSWIVAPVKIRNEVVGALHFRTTEPGIYDHTHIDYAQQIPVLLASALDSTAIGRETERERAALGQQRPS
jgi:transcriptional regulator with GAF, ATPase, and Fis domain